MISPETLKRIRHIEIQTRRLLNGALVGDSRSAVKGSGFEFDQIREYQPGDDVRFLDWKSSVRMNKLLVKQYIEERSRCIILAVDVSSSAFYTSSERTKYDVMAEVAAVLSLVADYGKDSVALLLFADEVELYIPPNKGRNHVLRIMQILFEYQPVIRKTKFKPVLERIATLKRKDAMIVMISDFIDIVSEHGFEKAMFAVSKSELIAIRCLDQFEQDFPCVGFLTIEDIETGERCLLDTRSAHRSSIKAYQVDRIHEQDRLFKRYGIDCLEVWPNRPFITEIIKFFRKRVAY